MNNDRRILKALLRQDLASFIAKVFAHINPGIPYEHNWHIDLLADYLTAAYRGEIKRLIINIPPRSLKSVCVSVAWPAWVLGQDATKRIMAASYSQSLSIKHSLDCRSILLADWYRELFPQTILSKKHNQKSKYLTTAHGFRLATSIGGMATGEGGDILLIDDPHNPSQINSPTRRKNVIEWYEQTFSSRLNNKHKGIIVLVMQRLHKGDLSGYLLGQGRVNWDLLRLPVCNEGETRQFAYGSYQYLAGEVLHLGRYNEAILRQVEEEMGSANFAAQYMQEPILENISLISAADLSYYNALPEQMEEVIASWDTAIKVTADSDYSVGTIWGIASGSYYLLYMLRAKMSYPELKANISKLAKRFNASKILIEDQASGQSLIQDLRAENYGNIIAIKPKLDKITRVSAVLGVLQSGMVKFPEKASYLQVLKNELTNFPHGKHDDIVDSISQFLNYVKTRVRQGRTMRIRVV